MMSENGDPEDIYIEAISRQVKGVVTGFVVLVEYIDEDGDQCIVFDTFRGQRAHRSLGLLQFALAVEQARVADAWRANE